MNARSSSLTFNGDHDWVASFFEGFDGGFEGGELVKQVAFGLRGRRGDQGRNP